MSRAPPTERRVWQRMLSGRRLDLLDPSPLDIEIEDIAHGLARVARWNGQTIGEHPFSVAQHSILVERIVEQLFAKVDAGGRLAALLHDAAEYVIGDMISPFKAVIGEDYRAVELRLSGAIHRRFGLGHPPPAATVTAIKAADRIAAFHEATALAGFERAEALRFFGQPRIGRRGLDLDPWPTSEAEERFRARFDILSAAVR